VGSQPSPRGQKRERPLAGALSYLAERVSAMTLFQCVSQPLTDPANTLKDIVLWLI